MKHAIISVALGLSLLFANGGIAYAQNFEKGWEAAQKGDFAKALKEWRGLAVQGDADAQYNLGVLYRDGKGVTQNYKEAVSWFFLSAAQGDADAQASLGYLHENGQGVTQDYTQAVRWYHLSASQGNAQGQFGLGYMYAAGQGVIQDNVYAHMWFNIAASNGNTDALKNRDITAEEMTAADISKAQDLARACVRKNYKGC